MTPIELVRLLIGDTTTSPYYMLTGRTIFTDEEIQGFLDLANQNINQAARIAAIAASLQLSGIPTRERTGDVEVWTQIY